MASTFTLEVQSIVGTYIPTKSTITLLMKATFIHLIVQQLLPTDQYLLLGNVQERFYPHRYIQSAIKYLKIVRESGSGAQ